VVKAFLYFVVGTIALDPSFGSFTLLKNQFHIGSKFWKFYLIQNQFHIGSKFWKFYLIKNQFHIGSKFWKFYLIKTSFILDPSFGSFSLLNPVSYWIQVLEVLMDEFPSLIFIYKKFLLFCDSRQGLVKLFKICFSLFRNVLLL